MNKPVITQNQPSLTEWFEKLGNARKSALLRQEDNNKSNRLDILNQAIGLPYEKPESFEARELTEMATRFKNILQNRGQELCAIRLVPKIVGLPKLRQRGLSIHDCYYNWFLQQKINPSDYIAEICPHSESLLWSIIFIVNKQLIVGEIVEGLHSQLTHGDLIGTPLQFSFDFQKWHWSESNLEAEKIAKQFMNYLIVPQDKQNDLAAKLNATYSHNFLEGYFEGTVWPNGQYYFIDYNRILPQFFTLDRSLVGKSNHHNNILNGLTVFPGVIRGTAICIAPDEIGKIEFPAGSVLICKNTDVRYLPLMKKAAAILTEQGGLLSHAAIVARELKKPCIVGVKGLLSNIKSNTLIEIDASRGTIMVAQE